MTMPEFQLADIDLAPRAAKPRYAILQFPRAAVECEPEKLADWILPRLNSLLARIPSPDVPSLAVRVPFRNERYRFKGKLVLQVALLLGGIRFMLQEDRRVQLRELVAITQLVSKDQFLSCIATHLGLPQASPSQFLTLIGGPAVTEVQSCVKFFAPYLGSALLQEFASIRIFSKLSLSQPEDWFPKEFSPIPHVATALPAPIYTDPSDPDFDVLDVASLLRQASMNIAVARPDIGTDVQRFQAHHPLANRTQCFEHYGDKVLATIGSRIIESVHGTIHWSSSKFQFVLQYINTNEFLAQLLPYLGLSTGNLIPRQTDAKAAGDMFEALLALATLVPGKLEEWFLWMRELLVPVVIEAGIFYDRRAARASFFRAEQLAGKKRTWNERSEDYFEDDDDSMFVTDDYSSQGVSTEDGADSADDDDWLHITRDFHKGKRSIKPLPQRMLD